MDNYDRAGIPITQEEWAIKHADDQYVRVARTSIMDAANAERTADISTVWLGDDHGHGDGPPVIFETMIFTAMGEEYDCRRYSTERQAREGHTMACMEIAALMTDPVLMDA